MTPPLDFWKAVDVIRARDERYAQHAYGFVMEALESTMHRIGARRHVGAEELIEGMVAFALDRYGVMSYTLLSKWGITTTEHIGDVVFQLVGEGVLSRRKQDLREDFIDVIDLRDALEVGYFEIDG